MWDRCQVIDTRATLMSRTLFLGSGSGSFFFLFFLLLIIAAVLEASNGCTSRIVFLLLRQLRVVPSCGCPYLLRRLLF